MIVINGEEDKRVDTYHPNIRIITTTQPTTDEHKITPLKLPELEGEE